MAPSHLFQVSASSYISGKVHSSKKHILQSRFGSPEQRVILVCRHVVVVLCGQSLPAQRRHKGLHVTRGGLLRERDVTCEESEGR